MKKQTEIEWIGVFLDGELMYATTNNYHNALEVLDYAKEQTIETGKLHEVKIYTEYY